MIEQAQSLNHGGTSLEDKRARAIAYLRSRGKYIVEQGCSWKPTSAAATDVRQTIHKARKK
jgi:hypothetical protein